ncbi:unnamed protein product [Penicillium nalgiovense]|nr:unnamed protein product [Penicillium nalgiovense]
MAAEKNNNDKHKRRRVALACEGCRQRKTRCDGVQPICGICLKRKIPCVYGKKYTRAHVSVEYVKGLEEKLGILANDKHRSVDMNRSSSIISEDNLNDNELDRRESVAHSATGSQGVAYPHTPVSDSHPGADQKLQKSKDTAIQRNGGTNFKEDDLATDAMGAGSGSTTNVTKDKGFYGRSAAMSFMKELFASVDDKPVDNFELAPEITAIYRMSRNEKERSSISMSGIVVPPRSVADGYVKNYFEYAYPLYPFIHKPTFMSAYEEIWSGDADSCEVDELFYSILNLIFAFGYRLSPLGERLEKNISANVYFERSQELLKFHLMDSGSLLLIQALLLTAQGRHVQEAPVYIDDEFITDTCIDYPPKEKASVLSFFSETVKLYDILADILKFFYSDTGPDYVDLFVSIFKFQEKLYDFQDNIPNHIKFESCLQESPYQRQSIVLRIRYLHLKIMLYRPVLFPKNRDRKRDNRMKHAELYVSSQRSISTLCVETAIELINLISQYRYADITLLPAVWYNNFYIYTATSVLLAARLQPFLKDEVNMDKFESAWNLGLELLASYLSRSTSAARCIKVLEMMNEKIRHSSQQKESNMNQADYENQSNISPSEVPSDLLLSLMYETPGSFADPFTYSGDIDRFFA